LACAQCTTGLGLAALCTTSASTSMGTAPHSAIQKATRWSRRMMGVQAEHGREPARPAQHRPQGIPRATLPGPSWYACASLVWRARPTQENRGCVRDWCCQMFLSSDWRKPSRPWRVHAGRASNTRSPWRPGVLKRACCPTLTKEGCTVYSLNSTPLKAFFLLLLTAACAPT
jgi:hypothetical protein